MRGRLGQVAMEYLIIVGITVAMTFPLILIFVTQSSYLEADISQAQLEKAGYSLAASAKQMYYAGPPSQKTVEVTFPEGIQTVTFANQSLIFTIDLAGDTFEYYQDMGMPINGSLGSFSGIHYIVVQATATGVQLTER